MQVEKQYCTLQLSKRLKELGVEQISQFYWSDFAGSKNELYIRKELGLYGVEVDYFSGLFFVRPGIESGLSAYSAYTVAELGVMLSPGYDTMKITIGFNDYAWKGFDLDGEDFPGEIFDTEAQCRAAMLISLIENNRVTVEEINKRLQNA